MERLYFVTEWDYCKGKTEQQHIKQFNIHTQHLPLVRRAFFLSLRGSERQPTGTQSLDWDIVKGEKSLESFVSQ